MSGPLGASNFYISTYIERETDIYRDRKDREWQIERLLKKDFDMTDIESCLELTVERQ